MPHKVLNVAMLLLSLTAFPAWATTVRMHTILGDIDIQLMDDGAPATVTNFLNYVQSGAYANSFIHRSVPGFIIQGGGYRSNSTNGSIDNVSANAPVVNEFSASRSNLRGTIAMAKLGSDPNSATSQWFFNLADNSSNLDNQNGGFTVFGEVTGNGMQVVDAIAALPIHNAGGAFNSLPLVSEPTSVITEQNLVIITDITVTAAPKNYSDSWWNANESGWGITITDHGANAFVQWYTYDQTGHNQKYVISGGTFSSDKCQFNGTIQHVTGPSWTLPTFDPNQVTRTTVGSGTFDFCPVGLPTGTAVFNYTADGVTGSKQLTRLSFGNDVPHQGGMANTGANDFTDLWWNPAESGWGVSVTQHGDNIFFRVFTYDTDNRPLLFVVAGGTFNDSATSFTGQVTLTSGPWFGTVPFDPNQVVRTTAGTATLTFTDANNGVLSYTVNGVTVTKSITRMVF